METLFTTSSSELTYRLSERVAFFLGNSKTERIELFDDIQKAYKVRSSVVHGDTLSASLHKMDLLSELSVKCDDVLRKAILTIYKVPNLYEIFAGFDNKRIDEYFKARIFGAENAPLVV